MKQLIKMESAINEALRLCSGAMSVRIVKESCDLEIVSTGESVKLRKDDRVMIFPQITHMDPSVYSEPEKFIWDRFLVSEESEDGEKLTLGRKFFKDGRWLKTSLIPFGGGISHCPGRYFAMNEIKIFVIIALLWFDIELKEDATLPKFDVTRAGLGIFPPIEELPFKYRWKF